MPPRHRRSYGPSRTRRRLTWATVDQSLTLAAGAGSNVDLLALLNVAGSNIIGLTVMRTHLELGITTTVSVGDRLRVGLAIGKASDLGPIAAGDLTPADPGLEWQLWRHETASPTFSEDGSNNNLRYDVKSRRRIRQLNDRYILSTLNSVGVSKTFTIQGRVLCALP